MHIAHAERREQRATDKLAGELHVAAQRITYAAAQLIVACEGCTHADAMRAIAASQRLVRLAHRLSLRAAILADAAESIEASKGA